MHYRKKFIAEPGKRLALKKIDPAFTDKYKSQDATQAELDANRQKLSELQPILWAQRQHSLLIVLQAMDAGGKDGTIAHVLGGLNPQGVVVTGFKVPTPQEAVHDFLWRVHPHAPARGYIAVFNRSHYEDVLAPRVHGLISGEVCEQRYKRIRDFEHLLVDNDTRILKFFLYISPEEQLTRFAARLDDPQRNWKISESDYAERPNWDKYMAAYEDAISATSTKHAPWYVIPSNHKWFRNLAVSQIIAETMYDMKLAYPEPAVDLREIRSKYHAAVRRAGKKKRR
ncbi:MAG TPA: polyphosphate kinase 2 family protein [Micropepsaceae bacterium]|nr:polyphosphate kinase 2 family protein [Micropepsaceae bacterium]